MFTRVVYLFPINYEYLPCWTYRGPVELSAVLPRFGDSSVPKRYGLQLPRLLSVRFRIYADFCKVERFVNDARLRLCKITGFKRYGLTAVMYRGFETVKTSGQTYKLERVHRQILACSDLPPSSFKKI